MKSYNKLTQATRKRPWAWQKKGEFLMQPQYIPTNPRFKDITGQRFGRLTPLYPTGHTPEGRLLWLCRCDCGKERPIRAKLLIRGDTQSCGCLHRQQLSTRKTKHGGANHPLYRTWNNMKSRCLNPNNKMFKNYGGRGIFVCDEWKDSFAIFYEHVIHLPDYGKTGHTLDRINNDGPYAPGNVRWATPQRQNRNTRITLIFTYQDRTQSLADWADEINIPLGTLHSRLNYGWSIEQTLGTPLDAISPRRGIKDSR
jgi:hypothetical protein